MPRQVSQYEAAWHPQSNRGVITMKLDGGGAPLRWQGENAAEFAAILQLLQHSDKPFVTPQGWIGSGPDDPGP
jgi:hypothetical protein